MSIIQIRLALCVKANGKLILLSEKRIPEFQFCLKNGACELRKHKDEQVCEIQENYALKSRHIFPIRHKIALLTDAAQGSQRALRHIKRAIQSKSSIKK